MYYLIYLTTREKKETCKALPSIYLFLLCDFDKLNYTETQILDSFLYDT